MALQLSVLKKAPMGDTLVANAYNTALGKTQEDKELFSLSLFLLLNNTSYTSLFKRGLSFVLQIDKKKNYSPNTI